MSISTHTAAQSLPYPYGPGYVEGRDDAFAEPRDIIAARIAWAYDNAADAWAADYAAGALSTYLLLDRLAQYLDTLGVQP